MSHLAKVNGAYAGVQHCLATLEAIETIRTGLITIMMSTYHRTENVEHITIRGWLDNHERLTINALRKNVESLKSTLDEALHGR